MRWLAQRHTNVLMDRMPVVGGMDTAGAPQALSGWVAVPIVATKANAFDEERPACAEADMNDFKMRSSVFTSKSGGSSGRVQRRA